MNAGGTVILYGVCVMVAVTRGPTIADMRHRLRFVLLGVAFLTLGATRESSMAASVAAERTSCVFRPFLGELLVGREYVSDSPTIRRRGSDILVDGESCGATVRNTDSIVVFGSDRNSESVAMRLRDGLLAPGKTHEPDGASEIEVSIDLGGPDPDFYDSLLLYMTPEDDTLDVGAAGIDLNGDGDVDVVPEGIGNLVTSMLDGSDTVMMTGGGSAGDAFPFNFVTVNLGPGSDRAQLSGVPAGESGAMGGAGSDFISTDSGDWQLIGRSGDDVLIGGTGDDGLDGEKGEDILRGRGGNDSFRQGDRQEQSDSFSGGSGVDALGMNTEATRDLSVSLDGIANDGGLGEHDNVAPDIEVVTTGFGNDVLVGTDRGQALYGRTGNDTIIGWGGRDLLHGGGGDDLMTGGGGRDTLRGISGNDDLTGGSGRDVLRGKRGDDVFHTIDGNVDRLWGGQGVDTAIDSDDTDQLHDIEVR